MLPRAKLGSSVHCTISATERGFARFSQVLETLGRCGESSRRKRWPGQFIWAALGSTANRACRNGTGGSIAVGCRQRVRM